MGLKLAHVASRKTMPESDLRFHDCLVESVDSHRCFSPQNLLGIPIAKPCPATSVAGSMVRQFSDLGEDWRLGLRNSEAGEFGVPGGRILQP